MAGDRVIVEFRRYTPWMGANLPELVADLTDCNRVGVEMRRWFAMGFAVHELVLIEREEEDGARTIEVVPRLMVRK